MFLINGPARMPNWIEVLASAVCPLHRPLHQKPAEANARRGKMEQSCRLACVNEFV